MTISTLVYETPEPLKDSERFLCFITQPAEVRESGKRTGNFIDQRLPMIFFGPSKDAAVSKAEQWWADTTRKAMEKIERGKAIGKAHLA